MIYLVKPMMIFVNYVEYILEEFPGIVRVFEKP